MGYKSVPILNFGVQMGYKYPKFILKLQENIKIKELPKDNSFIKKHSIYAVSDYLLSASLTATAQATVIPTIGLNLTLWHQP